MNEKLDLLSEAFGLNKGQRQLVLRVLWVISVSTILAYILGALTIIGIAAPYARAGDVNQIQQTVAASARVTLSQEIRAQARVRCQSNDPAVRDAITRYLDSLQFEYERVAGQRYPEPQCEVVSR